MSTNTLTSLAILKVNVDHDKDYLDYLRPFILHVLIAANDEPISGDRVSRLIFEHFGLVIPERAVEIVLRRIARSRYIERSHGVYRKAKDIPDPLILAKMADAERHIMAVVRGLQAFSQGRSHPISSDEDAVDAICAFLAEFDVTCLRAYLRGTAIPDLRDTKKQKTSLVLVSEYVQHLCRAAPVKFNSFNILVQGHMLANALMCPDLSDAPKNYKSIAFYLDTPLLVRALGAEGEAKQAAARDLIRLLRRLGGKVAAFSHSQDELDGVLRGAASFVDRQDGKGAIVLEARRQGTTKSDLLLLAESIDEKLSREGIDVEPTPRYIEEFQIDETQFEQVLEDEVAYYNPRAKLYDINSVRSIYVIRASIPARSLEKSKAVFVTTNSGFAKAAWEYGQKYEASRNVSSVITDFSLANMAWLKAPMETSSIPATQLLAYSYAALEPSNALLDKYLTEIDRLESRGRITARDHQLLRSSPQVYQELMHLTLGEEDALTDATISETLDRVSKEIKKEESEKLTEEQRDHQDTRDALSRQEEVNRQVVEKLYARCRRKANRLALVLSVMLAISLALGVTAGFGLFVHVGVIAAMALGSSVALSIMTLMNLLLGSTVKGVYQRLGARLLMRFIARERKAVGLDLNSSERT